MKKNNGKLVKNIEEATRMVDEKIMELAQEKNSKAIFKKLAVEVTKGIIRINQDGPYKEVYENTNDFNDFCTYVSIFKCVLMGESLELKGDNVEELRAIILGLMDGADSLKAQNEKLLTLADAVLNGEIIPEERLLNDLKNYIATEGSIASAHNGPLN